MSNYLFTVLVFLSTSLSSHPFPIQQKGGNLTIEITGLRNNKGSVLLSMYSQKDGFPSDPKKAYWKDQEPIRDGKARFEYKDLPAGTYAIAVLHDENGNLKMDTRFLGLPKEGYGFSRDPELYFGPPAFKNASFQHTADQTIQISARY